MSSVIGRQAPGRWVAGMGYGASRVVRVEQLGDRAIEGVLEDDLHEAQLHVGDEFGLGAAAWADTFDPASVSDRDLVLDLDG